MTRLHNIPWLRICAESVAIVVSILFAFAIDAWWGASIERDREQRILHAVLDDLDQTKANLLDGINFNFAVHGSNLKLLRVLTSNDGAVSQEEFDRLLLDMSWWDSEYPFSAGSVNSVIASGDLALIRNQEIRRFIADWPTRVTLIEKNRHQDFIFFWDLWAPFLRKNGLVPQLSEIDAPSPGRPGIMNPVAGLAVTDWKTMSSIIASEELHNLLSQKLWVQTDIIRQYESAISELEQITELIRLELKPKSRQ